MSEAKVSESVKILVLNVDDTEPMRYAKTRALLRAGFEVIEAGTGGEVLELVRTRQPALVMLDVKLPDMSGLDVCRMIKAEMPSVLVLQTSASFVKAADRVRGLEGGADSYLTMPTGADELIASVRALLRMGKAEAALREVNETLEKRVVDRTSELAWANAQLQGEIAQREAAQEALRQAQKMEAIGQLTGGIAHDFNNLLMAIIGNIEFLLRRLPAGADESRRYGEGAMASANHAATLTQRLLAFSRRQALQPARVDLAALAADTAELIRRTVGESITVAAHAGEACWPAWCDSNQMVNALLNLAINARDAMPDGGRLVIETSNVVVGAAEAAGFQDLTEGDYVMIAVSDNGVGMPADVAAQAFDPFFTTKPIGQGTGLGLSMVYGFIKQSKGHARIYSEMGIGTTVRLYVPRDRGTGDEAPDTTHVPEPAAPGVLQSGASVLVVEDDEIVRELVVQVLEDEGYTIREAMNGQDALVIIESGAALDLLVTDVGLPGMNGRQLAEIARQRRPGLKILFTTGYAHNAALDGVGTMADIAVLTKPFQLDQLAAKVRTMLEG